MLEKKPFVRYNLDKSADIVPIKLNQEERQELEVWKSLILQEKDSTALKQLARIGAKVLLEEKTKAMVELILNNYRKNKRQGIVNFD